ncbi:NAD(P)/FAD-dependent oxidoreductase [Lacinutrix sp.]|uniref:phytoene desaturase family protein n=1 Tax=Lacinutrix sp. TaxID=1937692 RepID=UPI0025C1DC9F|nr:phytoene desaturase family protein [Lacinutrix sp.]
MKKNIAIIGSGFSALSASCYLSKYGNKVTVFEKNETVGGRCRQLIKDGFTFDIGPSWYWMPDVFDTFFSDFNKKTSDYYQLDKLSPAYKIFFEDDEITIGDTMEKICEEFERIESGSSVSLKKFIKKAGKNYDIAINKVVLKPGISPLELITPETAIRVDQFFKTISNDVRKRFKNPKLISTLEFPVLFLGAKPNKTPAFYNFMNYADFGLGTWHPKGGMYEVIKAMKKLAEELGVTINTNSAVSKIDITNKNVKSITVNNKRKEFDIVLSGADYHHSETLLDEEHRQYSESYWSKKTFAPSSLLFYVGLDKKLKNVEHHNLFFDTSFETHAKEIYDDPKWPEDPLFYANFPSQTDKSMAPEGCETCFLLIPIAPGIEDTPQLRQHYFDIIIKRFETLTKQDVKNNVIFKESFCVKDFIKEYNSYKGNAYGMANTLLQTAFLRPKLKSKKVNNLYFTGQLTVPGPGVPPALISGKLVAKLINKHHNN